MIPEDDGPHLARRLRDHAVLGLRLGAVAEGCFMIPVESGHRWPDSTGIMEIGGEGRPSGLAGNTRPWPCGRQPPRGGWLHDHGGFSGCEHRKSPTIMDGPIAAGRNAVYGSAGGGAGRWVLRGFCPYS
jgi:hypothetical protein